MSLDQQETFTQLVNENNELRAELSALKEEIERLRRFETYVCQVIAMGNQADLTVESLPR